MNFLEKIKLLAHIVRWRLSWSKRDLDFLPAGTPANKFISARAAMALIKDGATVVSCGFGGCARCSVFFWAIREAFKRNGHPRQLTWMNVAAQGSRGRVPGTVEELGLPGLMKQYISGHHETTKAQLRLADQGQLELHTMPQGVMTQLFAAQERGVSFVESRVGLQTFMDPRIGPGSRVSPNAKAQYITIGEYGLKYAIPKIEIALFNAPYADREGNIYFKDAATISENIPVARAARTNGGIVIATVAKLIPKDESTISMKADEVDYIVVHPFNEQIVSVLQRQFWPMFTSKSAIDPFKADQKLKFINSLLRITPVRDEVDDVLARLAASIFIKSVPKGSMVNIGVGYAEEVARYLIEQGMGDDILFTTEAGAYGGFPAPGIFFGSAIQPKRLISSQEMFKLYQKELDVAILGFLQVDSQGNVNASKRGESLIQFVGPGGFPDIIDGAKTVIFVGSWMAKAKFGVSDGQMRIIQRGKSKFVDKVDQVTFSAQEGLRLGKKVYYITHVGVFQLTPQGLKLIQIMPGIDMKRDIIEGCNAQIYIPTPEDIPLVNPSMLTEKAFRLKWPEEVLL